MLKPLDELIEGILTFIGEIPAFVSIALKKSKYSLRCIVVPAVNYYTSMKPLKILESYPPSSS